MMSRSILGAIFVLIAAGIPAAAQTEPVLLTLDTTELDLVQRQAKHTTVNFTIPARLSGTELQIESVNILQAGASIDPTAAKIDIDAPAATPEHGALRAAFNLTQLQAAGSYIATITVSGIPRPAATPPAPATGNNAAPRRIEQTVQLKLTKRAAELRIQQPLQLQRTVYLPSIGGLFSGYAALEPQQITIAETQGKSWVSIDPTTWLVRLRKGDQGIEEGPLKVTLPSTINGWGQASATIVIDGPVPIGATTGTLTIRAPQLAAQTADFQIQMLARVSTGWLVVVIVIGIGIGGVTRGKLETRRAFLKAMIDAVDEKQRITGIANDTKDPKLKQDLETARDELGVAIDADTRTAETISKALAHAQAERERLLKAADDELAVQRTKLEEWRKAIMATEAVDRLASEPAAALRKEIADLKATLDDRKASSVAEALSERVPERARALAVAIERWLAGFDLLKSLKPWPDTKIADVSKSMLDSAQSVKQSTKQALESKDRAELFGKCYAEADQAARELQDTWFGNGVQPVIVVARSAADTLGALGTPPKDLPELETALERLTEATRAIDLHAIRKAVELLDTLWQALEKALTTAGASSQDGHFVEALEALSKRRVETKLNDPVAVDQAERERIVMPRLGPAAMPWEITLSSTATSTGKPVEAVARVITQSGAPEPTLTLRWSVDGRFISEGDRGELKRAFTFTTPGTVEIRAEARDDRGIRHIASTLVKVTEGIGGLRKALEQVEGILWVVPAAIITGAGWAIFAPSFVGTCPEFFAAFLWGFTVDIGLAKVIELSGSVKALKPTLPMPKVQ